MEQRLRHFSILLPATSSPTSTTVKCTPWTDQDLYVKFHLTGEEIAYLETAIRPME
ncbi:MAG: hypothetical protein IJ761_03755 [Bacteroidales bacterium]|nr:hypothetical protein [Bacteroidales bacterium]